MTTCDECGNDDAVHRHKKRHLCSDCLEELFAGPTTNVHTNVRAIDPDKVDPSLVSPHRLKGI